jgi:serine/threonine protein kinase/Tfp pilus assembly protein PilF
MNCPNCHSENPEESSFCGKCAAPLRSPKEKDPSSKISTLQTAVKELDIGSTFAGRYQVIEEIGKGGMGRVYKVFDKDVQEKVALKLLRPEIAADEKTIERFRSELKLARAISHRNVCRMHDLGRVDGTQYITMEFVAGEDLKSSIRRMGPLSVGKALAIAVQVAEGLAEAHRLGVVHRDLKPRNIMIDREGNARIMDFGVARSLKKDSTTQAGMMIGTPEYMSPEQVEGIEADARSDIYALGIVLYEMLAGRPPFEGDTPISVAFKHKTEKPRDPRELSPQIPEALSRLILKCMEKDRARRYQRVEDVLADLRALEEEISTTDRIAPEFASTTRTLAQQYRSLRRWGIVLFIGVLLAIAYFLVGPIVRTRLVGESMPPAVPQHSIAVISFENQTGDKAYDYLQEAIPNLLITSLEQSKYIRVTTWERMHDLLKQTGRGDVKVIDSDLGFELCRMDGIDAIVIGSFVKAGDTFATDVKVLDVQTKKLLKSASAKGEGVASILKRQIDDLSGEIAKGIGLSGPRPGDGEARITELSTGSMEAYSEFLKGRDEYEKFYLEDAVRSLESAVRIDPNFAAAYLQLGMAYGGLGDRRAMETAYEKAKTLSAKASEKDRLYIEALYAEAIEKDPEKSFRLIRELTERYPKEKRAHLSLAAQYRSRKKIPEAIQELVKALELDPDYGAALNLLAYFYADIGENDRAIEYFKRYAAASPGDANPIDSLAEFYFKIGKLDEAAAKFKEVETVKPGFGAKSRIAYIYALKENYPEAMRWIDQYNASATAPGRRVEASGWKAFYLYWLGREKASLDELERTRGLLEAVGGPEQIGYLDWIRGWIYFDSGDYAESRQSFESWFDRVKKERTPYVSAREIIHDCCLGLIDLKEGAVDSAKSRLAALGPRLDKVDPMYSDELSRCYHWFQAEVFLADGSFDEALTAAGKAAPNEIPAMTLGNLIALNTPFQQDLSARIYLRKGDTDKAIQAYEKLIAFDPASKFRRLIQPRFHYQLAKLYEQRGHRKKAVAQYEKFLALWGDADREFKEPADARARLAGLKGVQGK